VDLKVTVEKDGSISTTELISNQDNPRLVALAAEAASRWRFEPAKLREKPIPSEVILHFRFKRGSEAVQ
jgi:outer membrane biosynthesis protein TonB